jgi:hypothetical protein
MTNDTIQALLLNSQQSKLTYYDAHNYPLNFKLWSDRLFPLLLFYSAAKESVFFFFSLYFICVDLDWIWLQGRNLTTVT